MDSMFEATMRDLLEDASGANDSKFELGPIVNCEKRFLMQDSAPARRRPPEQGRSDSVKAAGASGSTIALSAKARGKQRAVDEMDFENED